MKPAMVLLLLSLGVSLSTMSAVAREAPPVPQFPEITFYSSSNLVLVDVVALHAKNGLSDKLLKRDDFQIFKNAHPVSIKTFDGGARFSTRPLALWFVVQCHRPGYEAKGSGLFRGQTSLFKPALKYLEKQDTVAVAHGCDDGDSRFDLLPTDTVEEAATTLEQVLAPPHHADEHDRAGEVATQIGGQSLH